MVDCKIGLAHAGGVCSEGACSTSSFLDTCFQLRFICSELWSNRLFLEDICRESSPLALEVSACMLQMLTLSFLGINHRSWSCTWLNARETQVIHAGSAMRGHVLENASPFCVKGKEIVLVGSCVSWQYGLSRCCYDWNQHLLGTRRAVLSKGVGTRIKKLPLPIHYERWPFPNLPFSNLPFIITDRDQIFTITNGSLPNLP